MTRDVGQKETAELKRYGVSAKITTAALEVCHWIRIVQTREQYRDFHWDVGKAIATLERCRSRQGVAVHELKELCEKYGYDYSEVIQATLKCFNQINRLHPKEGDGEHYVFACKR